jgi:hypothetical protein
VRQANKLVKELVTGQEKLARLWEDIPARYSAIFEARQGINVEKTLYNS